MAEVCDQSVSLEVGFCGVRGRLASPVFTLGIEVSLRWTDRAWPWGGGGIKTEAL